MEELNKFEERFWIVPADHPYCLGRNNVPDIYKIGDKWKIVWRSFDSMKQDNIYDSEAEARAAARQIAEKPVLTSAYDEEQLGEFSSFWLEATASADFANIQFHFKEVTPAILAESPQDPSKLN